MISFHTGEETFGNKEQSNETSLSGGMLYPKSS